MPEPLLSIRDLAVEFATDDGIVHAVDGVSFTVERGRTLGIVGESGSGKSVTSLAIMGLLPKGGADVSGNVRFDGLELLGQPARVMGDLRGNRIAMIFQEPMTSLNPAFKIGDQIVEAIVRHRKLGKAQAKARAIDMLRRVRIPSPEARFDEYPHKLSGGMRQRVMIAMALACDPSLLIADEPTTALDVTIQAQILDLMRKLQQERGTAVMLITHDLGVVAGMADRINVMYAGAVAETAETEEIFANPRHPYTLGLLNSIPRLDMRTKQKLDPIRGLPPDLIDLPDMCPFSPRCDFSEEICERRAPALREVGPGHQVSCWFDIINGEKVRRVEA